MSTENSIPRSSAPLLIRYNCVPEIDPLHRVRRAHPHDATCPDRRFPLATTFVRPQSHWHSHKPFLLVAGLMAISRPNLTPTSRHVPHDADRPLSRYLCWTLRSTPHEHLHRHLLCPLCGPDTSDNTVHFPQARPIMSMLGLSVARRKWGKASFYEEAATSIKAPR